MTCVLCEKCVGMKRNNKYLKSSARELVGKSSSSLLKHGAKLVFEGNQLINTARGITSVSGTLLTWGISNKYTIS